MTFVCGATYIFVVVAVDCATLGALLWYSRTTNEPHYSLCNRREIFPNNENKILMKLMSNVCDDESIDKNKIKNSFSDRTHVVIGVGGECRAMINDGMSGQR